LMVMQGRACGTIVHRAFRRLKGSGLDD